MIIRGESNIIKVYDLTPLVDISEYDLENMADIEKLQESVVSFLDSGEAEAVDLPDELIGVVPDGSEIEIDGNVYTFEDVIYENVGVDNLITDKFRDGDLLMIVRANGDGYFEYEENPKINDLKIGYAACDIETPKEEIYEFFCDLILPYKVSVNGEVLEVIASNFYPKDTMIGEVYIVKDGILEKITEIDMLHFGWDLFEDIIKVEYND